MSIAIIPARGGSKRIYKKNIKNFCGRPIIEWVFETVKSSKLFDHIIVSTEDDEIKKLAIKNDILVPFKRPLHLSDDYSGTIDVMSHAVKYLNKKGITSNNICCVYPTAVTLNKDDLVKSYRKFLRKEYDYIFSAVEYDHPIQRAFYLSKKNKIKMFEPDKVLKKRSQDYIKSYHDAGQFYWGTFNAWKTKQKIYTKKSSTYIIPNYRAIDINSKQDWKKAELIFKILKK